MTDAYPLETYGGYGSGEVVHLTGEVLIVTGTVADRLGRMVLNRAANRYNLPVRVVGPSQYHAGQTYEPGEPGYA